MRMVGLLEMSAEARVARRAGMRVTVVVERSG